MRTKAMIQRAGIPLSDTSLKLEEQLIEQYLIALMKGGRQTQTIRTYRRSMEDLYAYLPPEKEIGLDTLKEWKKYLKECGYSDSTVNNRLTAANGFLRYCGREDLTTTHNRIAPDDVMPEMTRKEYLQFLSAVRELGTEKYYFLIKVFATVDINIRELKYLTVEACNDAIMRTPDGRQSIIPSCLRKELLQYAERRNITHGPIFITRTGNILNRSNITNSIHRLAVKVGMDPEKCCPSALHRVYLTTQEELIEMLRPTVLQYYENLLNTEQIAVAWKS